MTNPVNQWLVSGRSYHPLHPIAGDDVQYLHQPLSQAREVHHGDTGTTITDGGFCAGKFNRYALNIVAGNTCLTANVVQLKILYRLFDLIPTLHMAFHATRFVQPFGKDGFDHADQEQGVRVRFNKVILYSVTSFKIG